MPAIFSSWLRRCTTGEQYTELVQKCANSCSLPGHPTEELGWEASDTVAVPLAALVGQHTGRDATLMEHKAPRSFRTDSQSLGRRSFPSFHLPAYINLEGLPPKSLRRSPEDRSQGEGWAKKAAYKAWLFTEDCSHTS